MKKDEIVKTSRRCVRRETYCTHLFRICEGKRHLEYLGAGIGVRGRVDD
jgi:hypothetical protein